MLGLIPEETSLEAKRHELSAMIAEGHRVVDALLAHQAATANKIEEALEGIQRLRTQLMAIDGAPAAEAPLTAPALAVVPKSPEAAVENTLQSQPFRPLTFMKCVAEGHEFVYSRAMPGYVTCRRCRLRRRA